MMKIRAVRGKRCQKKDEGGKEKRDKINGERTQYPLLGGLGDTPSRRSGESGADGRLFK